MSGWDEGGVYYSDQAQFPHGGGDRAETANRHQVLQKFKEFMRNFQHKSQPNVFPYREALLSNPRFVLVDLADLISYDPDQTLPQFLRQNPADYIPLGSMRDWRNGGAGSRGSAGVIDVRSGSCFDAIPRGTVYFKTCKNIWDCHSCLKD